MSSSSGAKIFRETNVSYSNGNIILKNTSIKDIFKFGEPPYMCVGSTGGGKTTIAIDIIYKFAPQASQIYYISATKDMIGEGAINQIPNVFRRSPGLEDLDAVWKEIKSSAEQSKTSTQRLMSVLGKFYDSESVRIITDEIKKFELDSKETGVKSETLECIKIETLTRLILAGVEDYGTDNLSAEEMSIISSLSSTPQKFILILDDVTAELEQLKTSKGKYNYNGNLVSRGEAYKSILIDIFTKIRHYNAICVLFVHDWKTIDMKSQLTNFILLDATAASNLANMRSISDVVREKARICSSYVFNHGYKYYFLVIKENGQKIMVSKADLHEEEQLEVDELNQNLIEAYEKVSAGVFEEGGDKSDDESSENGFDNALDDNVLEGALEI